MEISALAQSLSGDTPPDLSGLIAALPAEVRGNVDELLRAQAALDAAQIPMPPSPLDLVVQITDPIVAAARSGKAFSAVKLAGDRIATLDSEWLAFYAVQRARRDLGWELAWAVDAAMPEAFAIWSDRVAEIAAEIKPYVDAGTPWIEPTYSDGKATFDRYTAQRELLAEYNAITAAWSEARYRASGGHDRGPTEAPGRFRDRCHGDERFIEPAITDGVPSLIAAVRLGWTPWCPTAEQQREAVNTETERRLKAA